MVLNVITGILESGKGGRSESEGNATRKKGLRAAVLLTLEVEEASPPAEWTQLEAGKGTAVDSPTGLQKESALQIPRFSPARTILDF